MKLEFELGSVITIEEIIGIPEQVWGIARVGRSDGIETYPFVQPELYTESEEAEAAVAEYRRAVEKEAAERGEYWHEYDSPLFRLKSVYLGASEHVTHQAGAVLQRTVTVVEIDKA